MDKPRLFKDKDNINHNNMKELTENLSEIARLIEEAGGVGENNPVLIKRLLGNAKTEKKQNPNHSLCAGCDTGRMTEKRMCRCMYYYNLPEKRAVSKCKECCIKYKWKNVGDIEVIEYEYPTEYLAETIGGMDLFIRDGDKEFAVEVKPKKSKESLARMFAEILTYTLEYTKEERQPAICFFENSKQWKQYIVLKNMGNESLEYIEKYIKVYYFKVVKSDDIWSFEILPMKETW